MIDLKRLAKLLEEDEEGRGRIADILASEIAVRSRRLIVESVLREVATKEDLKELRDELKEYIDLRFEAFEDKLNERLNGMEDKLNERLNGMEDKLNDRLNGMEDKLNERLSSVEDKLNERLNGMEDKLNERFMSLEKRFDMLTRFTLGTFVGIMLTLASVVLTRLL